MFKGLDFSFYKKFTLFESYIVSSFLVSIYLWAFSALTINNFFVHSFLPSLFIVGHWGYYSRWPFGVASENEKFYGAGLFLFQVITLVSMSFSFNSSLMLVMALVPCVCGSFYFFEKSKRTNLEEKSKGPGLFLIGGLSYIVLNSLGKSDLMNPKDLIVFTSFTVWVGAITYLGGVIFNRNTRSLVKNVYRKSWDVKNETDPRENFFFHDLINHTHGMSLFLNQKVFENSGMTKEDTKSMLKEVKVMQSLIDDYCGIKHKNLTNTIGVVSFNSIRPQIEKLIENYFDSNIASNHIIYSSQLTSDSSSYHVHFPSFYRIMTNLVKNAAENSDHHAEFIFSFENNELTITVKNKVLHLKEDHNNLSKNLEGIILELPKNRHSSPSGGIGLESIALMCENSGGTFRFKLDGDYWVNIVTLPSSKANQNDNQNDNPNDNQENDKKVAS